jgi:hypothetical protein
MGMEVSETKDILGPFKGGGVPAGLKNTPVTLRYPEECGANQHCSYGGRGCQGSLFPLHDSPEKAS